MLPFRVMSTIVDWPWTHWLLNQRNRDVTSPMSWMAIKWSKTLIRNDWWHIKFFHRNEAKRSRKFCLKKCSGLLHINEKRISKYFYFFYVPVNITEGEPPCSCLKLLLAGTGHLMYMFSRNMMSAKLESRHIVWV